jgi:hypothetical protein
MTMPGGAAGRWRRRGAAGAGDALTPQNTAMLRELLSRFQARLVAYPEPAADTREAAIHADLRALLAKPFAEASWTDAQRCELDFARLMPAAELRPEIDRKLATLKGIAPDMHQVFAERWTSILAPDPHGRGGFDEAAARALLVAATEEVQWHSTRHFHIRRLGVAYAGRLVGFLLLAILIGLALVLWEVYFGGWPLDEARFSGLPMSLVSGLLGASFSALTQQRRVTGLANLEEVVNAIGYKMILLRLGVGVSAAALLYFFFESGLVEGVLFPDLGAVGFDPIILSAGPAEGGGQIPASLDALRRDLAAAQDSAARATEALAVLGGHLDGSAAAESAARAAQQEVAALQDALDVAAGEFSGPASRALGPYVPNAELSKLVVWSFLAGFSEKLVPSLLGRIDSKATDTPAK